MGGYGIYFSYGSHTIKNNIIIDNTDGIYIGGNGTIENNTIDSNNTDGIDLYYPPIDMIIKNNIITNNGGYGITDLSWTFTGAVDYNDVWNNTSGNYSGGVDTGTNDISADPLFVNRAGGDYHLKSCSPCIDKGDTSPYDNEPQPNGGRINMGAYGNTLEAANNPEASAEADEPICLNETLQLYGYVVGGTNPYDYYWEGPDDWSSNQKNPTRTPPVAGTYYLTVTDTYNCADSSSVIVTVNPSPTANAGSDVSICTGTCTTLDGSASGGSPFDILPGYTYSWSPTDSIVSGTNTANPTVCPDVATTYTLTVEDSKGCTDSDTVVVKVDESLIETEIIALSLTGCAPLTVNFSDSTTGDVLSYLWNFGDDATSSDSNPTHIYNNPGTYTVSLTVSDTCGTDTDQVVVTVNSCVAELILTKTSEPQGGNDCLSAVSLYKGDTIAYTLWCQPFGDTGAANVVLTDYLDLGVEVVDTGGGTLSGSILTWDLGTIPANQANSSIFTVKITADSGTCIANYAQISADNADTVYSDTIIHQVVGAVGCADIIYVNGSTGSDTNDGLDTATAKKTISAGVEAVCSGGTVYVAAGTYTEAVYINKRIALIGQGTPTIKPPSSANGVTFSGAATDGALISGFRITGATGDWPNGIGIWCENGAEPTIINNIIIGNAYHGIHCDNSSPNITNNTIAENAWDGIHPYNSSPSITNNTITGNSWGISCDNSSPIITNNTIAGNSAHGILCGNSSPFITNNIIVQNGTTSTDYYGIYNSGGNPTINYNCVWGNGSGGNNNYGGCPSGLNDISLDPQFIGGDDYHVQASSPCIDKGTNSPPGGLPSTDKDGNPRPYNGGIADMGAYEYQGTPYTCTVTANAGADDTICSGTCTTLNGLASGGSPDYTYSWTSSPAGFTSSDSITTVCPIITTTYTLTVEDANGCTGTDQVTVTVMSLTANAGADVSVCSGSCTTLNGSATGGSGNYGYSWSPATGLSNPNIAKPRACPTGITTYTLTVTDNTCETTDIDQVRVTVNPCIVSLGLTKSSDPEGDTNCTKEVYQESIITYTLDYRCLGDARAVNVKIVDYLDPGLTPLTYPGGTYNSSDHTITWNLGSLDYYDHGTRGITCRVVASPGSCLTNYAAISADNFAPITTEVVIHQVIEQLTGLKLSKSSDPAGDANCTRQVLKGKTIAYTLNYEWPGEVEASQVKVVDYLDPDLAPISYPGGEYDSLNHTLTYDLGTLHPGDSKSLIFTAEVMADSGTCIANYAAISSNNAKTVTSDTITHYIIIPFTADAGADVSICSGDCTILGGSPSAAGGVSPYTYLWSPGGLSGANPAVCPDTTTTTYTLTVTDNDSQTDVDQVVVTVNPSPTANAGADDAICSGTCATLNGLATGGTPAYTYAWSPGGLTGQNPSVCPTATTTYTLTVTDANGCSDTDRVAVVVNTPPTANAGADVSVCSGTCTTLNGQATGGTGPYTYTWSPIGSTSQNPQVCPMTTTIYTLTVTDANGCAGIDQVTITVNPSPTVNAGVDDNICSGTCATLNGLATGGTPAYTYAWSPITGLSNSNIANPQACPTATTTYTLTVTDSNGCQDSDSLTITVNPCVARLTLTKTSEPLGDATCTREAYKGETITYTLHYESLGDIGATNTTIVDHLDPGLSPLTYPGGRYNSLNRTITYDLGTLNPSNSGDLTITCQVTADSDTCIKNYACIRADNVDTITTDTITHHLSSHHFIKDVWTLTSLPFSPINSDPASIYGSDASVYHWNPQGNEDKITLKYETPSLIEPAKGYWVKVPTDREVVVSGGLIDGPFSVLLYPSWNQIGSPFLFDVDWSSVRFLKGGVRKTPSEAEAEGWISNVIYWHEGSLGYLYGPGEIYPDPRLSPWMGYWIKVDMDGVSLEIPNTPAAGSSSPGLPYLSSKKTASLDEEFWTIQIMAESEGSIDLSNFIGVRPNFRREYDAGDVEEPPFAMGAYIRLGFPHYDWSRDPGLYTSDYRPPVQDQEVWDFVVSSNLTDKEITLSWKNVEEVPGEYDLTLLDKETGQRIDMRKSASCTTGGRSFSVIVKKDSSGSEPVVELFCYPNPVTKEEEVTLRVRLTKEAEVKAKIYDIAGELVVEELPLTGDNLVHEGIWDLKNDKGKKIASGVYLFCIEADGKMMNKIGKIAVKR